MDTWSKTLIDIVKELNTNNIAYVLVASGALKVLGVEITPYDIDLFTTKENVKKCRKIFEDIAINDMHVYKDQSGEYIEFQAILNEVPIEFCELKNANFKDTTKVEFYGVDITIPNNTIESELEKNREL